MKQIILGIIFLSLISSPGYCQNAIPPLELTIKSNKQIYAAGEEINITASIRNNGTDALKIYSPIIGA